MFIPQPQIKKVRQAALFPLPGKLRSYRRMSLDFQVRGVITLASFGSSADDAQ